MFRMDSEWERDKEKEKERAKVMYNLVEPICTERLFCVRSSSGKIIYKVTISISISKRPDSYNFSKLARTDHRQALILVHD